MNAPITRVYLVLTVRGVRTTPVLVPMTYALGTSAARVTASWVAVYALPVAAFSAAASRANESAVSSSFWLIAPALTSACRRSTWLFQ